MQVEQPLTVPNSGPTNRLWISLRSPKEMCFDPKTWTLWLPRLRKASCGTSWGEIVDDEGNVTRIWPRQKASPMMKLGLGFWKRWEFYRRRMYETWSCWLFCNDHVDGPGDVSAWIFICSPVWFRNNPCPSSGAIREIFGVYLTNFFIHNVGGRYDQQQKTNISQNLSRRMWTGTWFFPECFCMPC